MEQPLGEFRVSSLVQSFAPIRAGWMFVQQEGAKTVCHKKEKSCVEFSHVQEANLGVLLATFACEMKMWFIQPCLSS